ncbi:MAG: AMP-binding protein [Burkholderiales bacterium]
MSAAPVDAIARHAAARPDAPAVVMAGSGDTLDWRTLEQASRRIARALVDAGLGEGDCIAILAENRPEYLVWMWAARRAGLYYTTLSTHWRADEAAHVLADCGAKALFATRATLDVAAAAAALAPALRVRLIADEAGDTHGTHDTHDGDPGLTASAARFVPVPAWIAGVPADAALPVRLEGTDFLYSSGTTGHPKGIRRPLAQLAAHDLQRSDLDWKRFDAGSVYLSTAPMYHSAPVRWTMQVLRAGGCCVVMERFDAEAALRAIEHRRVTHAQFVPTMFVRLLRLPPEVRDRHDRSSLRHAIHAAAPCPVDVKRAMIDWWGPIVTEYYSGTEAIGRTSISSREWLERPGSVGRPELGRLHVVGEDGSELGPGETGLVCFSGVPPFVYHGDPERTRAAYDALGRANIGDVGHVDADGYLYLTDRASHMIISGGVNVYPQETENLLVGHPAVGDVAVIGVPDPEFGEAVKAVVVPRDGVLPSEALGAELIAWCRARLSPIKCPRSVDFVAELPRTEAGKLLKRVLRAAYAAR